VTVTATAKRRRRQARMNKGRKINKFDKRAAAIAMSKRRK